MKITLIDNKPVGKKLSALRKKKGYTQLELAELLNVSRSTITEYERGRININVDTLIKLAVHFQVSADEILGLKSTPPQEPDESLRIMKRLRKIKQLSEAKQKVLLHTIDSFLRGEGI